MSDDWAELLLEFIEALVHQIVCLREVYRADVFERQRLYGVAVKRSRHPLLNEYIHEVVAGLKVRPPRPSRQRGERRQAHARRGHTSPCRSQRYGRGRCPRWRWPCCALTARWPSAT